MPAPGIFELNTVIVRKAQLFSLLVACIVLAVYPIQGRILATNLKAYCERDTYAMYAIWQYLNALK